MDKKVLKILVVSLMQVLIIVMGVKMHPQSAGTPPSIYEAFQQQEYVVEIERTEIIRFDKTYISHVSLQTFKYNRTYAAINASMNVVRDFQGNLTGRIQAYKFQSNEYREFPIVFDINMCKALSTNAFGIENIFKCGNWSPCPFRKGNYKFCNWGPDYSKFPPYVPTGRYKFSINGFLNSRDLFLLEGYAAIKSLKWDFG